MKRPGLGNLGKHLASKPEAAEPEPVEEIAAEPRAKGKRGSQPDGRKGVLLRLSPEAWLALKQLAAEETLRRGEIFTMQSALEEALNDYFRKHKRPAIA
ncbi:hypothetical protein GCM10011390_50330 [Aureimonas endophytica]|uniref:Uncharacterized protein n=1 Tax=Aureimonas endophytica TaxID=2027858 RepID=A0A917A422_9HYPH|nr:hypothetical protein [Aureimonas endophytica]GGE24842.1 hypothetical protein GCM10011390_50330 [Aureimonas endophytica]